MFTGLLSAELRGKSSVSETGDIEDSSKLFNLGYTFGILQNSDLCNICVLKS